MKFVSGLVACMMWGTAAVSEGTAPQCGERSTACDGDSEDFALLQRKDGSQHAWFSAPTQSPTVAETSAPTAAPTQAPTGGDDDQSTEEEKDDEGATVTEAPADGDDDQSSEEDKDDEGATATEAPADGDDDQSSEEDKDDEGATVTEAPAGGDDQSSEKEEDDDATATEEDNSPEPTKEDTQAPTSDESSESDEEAAEDAPKVSAVAWEEFQLLNDLRAQGFACSESGNSAAKSYAPNSVKLRFDCNLWRASRAHSKDMAKNNFFDHTSPSSGTFADRATEAGYKWTSVAENIAAGSSKAAETLEQWKKSPGHCHNMMNPDYKDVAIGYAFDESADYQHYWTEKLGTTDEETTDTSCYP